MGDGQTLTEREKDGGGVAEERCQSKGRRLLRDKKTSKVMPHSAITWLITKRL